MPYPHVFDDEHHLAPRFVVQGLVVVLSVFELVTLRTARLGPWITRLDDDPSRAKIQRALDELLSQA